MAPLNQQNIRLKDLETSLLPISHPPSTLPVPTSNLVNLIDLEEPSSSLTPFDQVKAKIESLVNENHLEIDPKNLTISNEQSIGSGFFGVVYRAKLRRKPTQEVSSHSIYFDVAVKESSNNHDISQKKLVYEELKVMCGMKKHPNILSLVGVVIERNVMLIMEYVEGGDLLKFLKRKSYVRYQLEPDGDALCMADLLSFAFQIAHGMQYLERVPCVHRDLALRNVLIKRNGVIRIADFGLARRHENKDYYRTRSVGTAIPLNWLAPECFEGSINKFDSKSDVWSFGVCLFELFSLGEPPYKELESNNIAYDLLLADFLRKGNQLSQPEHCTLEIYTFMKACWNLIPEARPSFSACTRFFQIRLNKLSEEFFIKTIETIESEANEQRCYKKWI
eukprot:NP_492970.3 protein KINase [Caenorhabditis elegans]